MTFGRSYLPPAAAAQIDQARRNILATRMALQEGGTTIIVRRRNPVTDEYVPRSEQVVALTLDRDRRSEGQSSVGAESSTRTGRIEHEAPFDIQVDDRFILSNEWVCVVTAVLPERAGIVRAEFRADAGYRP